MTKWFKCNKCDYVSLSPWYLHRHLKNHHSITTKNSYDKLVEFIVKDQQEIENLKKRKVRGGITNTKLLRMWSEIQVKDEIEIEEHSVEDEDNDSITKNDGTTETSLSDLNSEWLILGP